MRKQATILLKLLRNELERSVIPTVEGDRIRATMTLASKVIRKELVYSGVAMAHYAKAMAEISALVPTIAGQLGGATVADLAARLETGDPAEWAAAQAALQPIVSALMKLGSPAGDAAVAVLVGVEARLRQDLENVYAASAQVGPAAEGGWDASVFTASDQERLAAYLRAKLPSEQHLTITNAKPLAGGFSKQTVILDLAGNHALPDQIVMRREAPFTTSGGNLLSEYAVLTRLFAAGVAVAEPFDLEETGKVLDTRFMITSRVHGGNIGDSMVVAHNPAVSADLATIVAAIHGTDWRGLEDALPGGRVSPGERLRGELEYDDASWDSLEHFKSGAIKAALEWLKRNIHLADGPAVIVHRDLGMHNILVQDDRIAAILDWETVSIGVREDDLGLLYHSVRQMDDWNRFIAQYEASAGVSIDRAKLNYFILAGLVRMAVLVARIGNAILEEHMDGIPLMFVGECISDHLNNCVCEVLNKIMSGEEIR